MRRSDDEVGEHWVFKGGTALAKCHFTQYRFSEDLDFTCLRAITGEPLLRTTDCAGRAMQESVGVRTDAQATVIDVIRDDYGRESFEARVYYRGPWDYGGSLRSLRIHPNRDESMLFPSQSKPVRHTYSDRSDLPEASIRVYSLEEILAEKLRAFSGQRRYAIARDLYDIRFLSDASVRIAEVLGAFPKKCAVKGMEVRNIDLATIVRRKSEYEANWENNLEYLIPENLKVPFEDAWAVSIDLLRKAIGGEFS